MTTPSSHAPLLPWEISVSLVRRSSCLCLALLLSAGIAPRAGAQIMSARRMAMGGVALVHGGPGSEGMNVAYRAVKPAPGDRVSGFSLPIGLIPVLQDPPTFDSKDSSFNAFRLANLVLHPPWNLALVKPAEPTGDLTLSVGRNALTIDLGSLRDAIPGERVRFSSRASGPALVVSVGPAFVGLAPLIQAQNDFDLNGALRDALHDGRPFQTNTEYALTDQARGQAAAQAMLGAAIRLGQSAGNDDRNGFYVGARAKLLRGFAYADADEKAGFTTADTLFGNAPVDVRYAGRLRSAEASDGGWGQGFDAGAVFVSGSLELGLAANDIAEHIGWKVKETVTAKDSVTGNYVTTTLGEGISFTSTVPTTELLTATTHLDNLMLAADVQRDALEQIAGHAGAELWFGSIALRGGLAMDAQRRVQMAGGVGLKLGRIGLDLAVATNQANLTHERAVDLGAGLSFYPSRSR